MSFQKEHYLEATFHGATHHGEITRALYSTQHTKIFISLRYKALSKRSEVSTYWPCTLIDTLKPELTLMFNGNWELAGMALKMEAAFKTKPQSSISSLCQYRKLRFALKRSHLIGQYFNLIFHPCNSKSWYFEYA